MIKSIILSTIYIINYTGGRPLNPIHPCDRFIERLSLNTRMKIAIGCSKVEGKNLYSYEYLNDLAEGKYEQI